MMRMMSDTQSVNQINIHENNFSETKNSSQEAVKINGNFVESVDFESLTVEWTAARVKNYDLKILRIEKCPNSKAVVDHLIELDIGVVANLCVLVMVFPETTDLPTKTEFKLFCKVFKDNRQVFLQFKSHDGKIQFFVENFTTMQYSWPPFPKFYGFADVKGVQALLEAHIEAQASDAIFEQSVWSECTAQSGQETRLLCLMDVTRNKLIPWLTDSDIRLNEMKLVFAHINYPLGPEFLVEYAIQSDSFDNVEKLISKDYPLPLNDGLVNQCPPECSAKLEKMLNQRQALHKSITNQKTEEVSRILKEMEKSYQLKHAYQSNESAMATVLRNFNVDVYALMLNKNLQFCAKSVELMKSLPEITKQVINETNKKFFTPMSEVPGQHQLLSKCFLATGHIDVDFYSKKVSGFLWELQNHQDTSQLLRIMEKSVGLKIVFDFNHDFTGLMKPRNEKHFNCYGLCCCSGTIYVAGKRTDSKVKATLIHEIAHQAMRLVYRNDLKPFLSFDHERKQEYEEVIKECKEVYEKGENVKINVFNLAFACYKEENFAEELIVRVSQVLIEYAKDDVEAVKEKYQKLFAYYYKYIAADIDAAFPETSRKEFFEINRSFVQTVDFGMITNAWVDSKKFDDDLKVLVIENCPTVEAVSVQLHKLNISAVNSLFVLVFKISEEFDKSTEIDFDQFVNVFEDKRPVILQIVAPDGSTVIYVKDHLATSFLDVSLLAPYNGDISILKEMLETHGFFNGDILTTKLSYIAKEFKSSSTISSKELYLRFMNLFRGGVSQIIPWATPLSVVSSPIAY